MEIAVLLSTVAAWLLAQVAALPLIDLFNVGSLLQPFQTFFATAVYSIQSLFQQLQSV